MNTLLNYPGAKWGMAAQIVSLMPPHRSYLEPFFGSGAVLFNKPPSAIETVNDIDGDVVNFFRVLREQPDRLAEAISLTPYAREVFDDAHANRGTDDFDRAYRFAIRSKMGHGFKTYCFEQASRKGCPGNWKYIDGCMRNLAQRGIKTIADIEDYELGELGA